MSRTRSTDVVGTYQYARWKLDKANQPGTWANLTTSNWRERLTSSMTDVVTGEFHKLVRQGIVINSPATRSVNSFVVTPMSGSMLTRNSKSGYWYQSHVIHSTPEQWCNRSLNEIAGHYVQPTYPDVDVDYVIQKAWSDLDTSSAAVLASIGELHETIAFANSVISRTCKVFRVMKRGLFLSPEARKYWRSIGAPRQCAALWTHLTGKSPAQWPSVLRTAWLEARYALRPLAYDFMAIKKALESTSKPVRVTGRAYSRDENHKVCYEDSWMMLRFPTQGKADARQGTSGSQFTYTTKKSRNVRAGVLAAVDVKSDYGMYANALGLHNLPEAMWDLTPFSFILDWFIDVSTWIEAWTPEPGVHPLCSWVYVQDIWDQVLSCTPHDTRRSGDYTDQITGTMGSMQSITSTWTRTPNPDLSLVPHLNVRLKIAKVVDLIAIGSQLLNWGRIR